MSQEERQRTIVRFLEIDLNEDGNPEIAAGDYKYCHGVGPKAGTCWNVNGLWSMIDGRPKRILHNTFEIKDLSRAIMTGRSSDHERIQRLHGLGFPVLYLKHPLYNFEVKFDVREKEYVGNH